MSTFLISYMLLCTIQCLSLYSFLCVGALLVYNIYAGARVLSDLVGLVCAHFMHLSHDDRKNPMAQGKLSLQLSRPGRSSYRKPSCEVLPCPALKCCRSNCWSLEDKARRDFEGVRPSGRPRPSHLAIFCIRSLSGSVLGLQS